MTQDRKNTDWETPPSRRNWPDAVGRDANTLGRSSFAKAGFRDPTLVLRWSEIAGLEVARIAQPIRLSEGPSGGVLTLRAEPGAALFLQHESRALCERINAFLGSAAVSKLRFVQGPLARKPVRKPGHPKSGQLAAEDPAHRCAAPESLKTALLRLARARQRENQRD
jgi:hypothetical protein